MEEHRIKKEEEKKKATLGKLLRDGVERILMGLPVRTDTILN